MHRVITETIDDRGLTITQVAIGVGETREMMVLFLNDEITNDDLLYRVFNTLYFDWGERDFVFISEIFRDKSLSYLKEVYSGWNDIIETPNLFHMSSYQRDVLKRNVLRKIVNLENKKY
jgi:hypothetical protein